MAPHHDNPTPTDAEAEQSALWRARALAAPAPEGVRLLDCRQTLEPVTADDDDEIARLYALLDDAPDLLTHADEVLP